MKFARSSYLCVFEMGTKNHEGLAGTTAAINYLADLGAEFGAPFADKYPEFEGRRLHLKTAMAAPACFDQRMPTVAFTLDGYTPRQVAE